MAVRDMLDKICRILRSAPQKRDAYNTPISEPAANLACVAEGVPCALSRRVLAISQEDGRTVLTDAPRLYMLAHEDLREGDLVDIDGAGRFRCGRPYRPRNHHIECDVESASEV